MAKWVWLGGHSLFCHSVYLLDDKELRLILASKNGFVSRIFLFFIRFFLLMKFDCDYVIICVHNKWLIVEIRGDSVGKVLWNRK